MGAWVRPSAPLESRTVFAAAHVVADPLADNTPGAPAALGMPFSTAQGHFVVVAGQVLTTDGTSVSAYVP